MGIMNRFIFLIIAAASLAVTAQAKDNKSTAPDSYNFTRGLEEFSQQNYSEASSWFRKELNDNEKNGYAHLYMAVINLLSDEAGEVLTSTAKAFKYLPAKDKETRATTYRTRAKAYMLISDTTKAEADLLAAVKLLPEEIDNYQMLGDLYYDTNRLDQADAIYDKITAIEPGNTLGFMGKGRNETARKNYGNAVECFNHVIKLAPEYANAYSFRAEALIGLKRYNDAAEDIVRALTDNDSKAAMEMRTFPKEGLASMHSKLTRKVLQEPKNPLWPYYQGMLYEVNDEYDKAVESYMKSNDADANPTVLVRAATCRFSQQRNNAALKLLDRAVDLDPEDVELQMQRGVVLGNLGRHTEEIEAYDLYIAKHPDEVAPYGRRGWTKLITGDYAGAIADLDLAIALDPTEQSYHTRRGRAHLASGNEELGMEDFETAIAMCDTVAERPYEAIAIAAGYLGDNKRALEAIDSLKAQSDTITDKEYRAANLYNIACGLALLNQADSAMSYLNRAVATDYLAPEFVASDPDLRNLHSMPAYSALIDSLRSVQLQIDPPTPVTKPETGIDDIVAVSTAVSVPFTKESGVTKVKCSINGLPLYFIFDTGASQVTISMVEANFMLKNQYITPADVIGSEHYMDANGNISEGTVLNLKNVEFGGVHLDNVRASVVRNQKAPLLLGQSVLGRLGKIEIDNSAMQLRITPSR